VLTAYLDDHAAMLAGTAALLGRMRGADRHAAIRDLLGEIADEVEDDRRAIDARLRELGASASQAKQALALAAERLGRLKPNGSLLRETPLTPIVELEWLMLGLDSARALWRGLEAVASPGPGDAAARAVRTERRLAQLEDHRLALVAAVGSSAPNPG
jgi:hypothetical protein